MIHDEGRLDHLVLAEGIEEQVDDVALLVARLIGNLVLVRDFLCLLVGFDLVKIDAGLFLNGFDHGQSAERLAEVDGDAGAGLLIAIVQAGRAAYLLCDITEHGLGQFHHTVVIGVGLVELHQGEFRVMPLIESLVAEHAADLKHTLHAADDETLQVELQ